MLLAQARIIEGRTRIVGMDIARENNLKIIEISVDSISQCSIMTPSKRETHKQTRRHIMTNLINKLSKIDQRSVQLAIIHANNGNYRAIDSMIRGANKRSESTLKAIRAAL